VALFLSGDETIKRSSALRFQIQLSTTKAFDNMSVVVKGMETESPPLVIIDPDISEEYPTAMAARIASYFDLPRPVETYDFPEKGNINQHTFLILAGRTDPPSQYLLQRINQRVFARPKTVMTALVACLEAQAQGLEKRECGEELDWETITLIPTKEGKPYLIFRNKRSTTYWRLMIKVPDCKTYKSLSEIPQREEQLFVAQEAGRGLALFGDLTEGMDISKLENPLPGYRDTQLYYNQLSSVLAENRTPEQAGRLIPSDEVLRNSTEQHFLVHAPEEEFRKRKEDPELKHFIKLALEHRDYGLMLLREMEAGRVRKVAIHGDTKRDNFLFSTENGCVRALVDLDTIMPHSWLTDWGDMVRSLSNLAGEREMDLSMVQVDTEIYEALARGFLSTARRVTQAEVLLMVDAVQLLALELGIRFLADYLRGDSYFRLGATDLPNLNKTRAMVQLTLYERLREEAPQLSVAVERLWKEYRS
jgi:hypothetical protein